MAMAYDFNSVSKAIDSVLTGEVWDITFKGDGKATLSGNVNRVISVDGLPKIEEELIEVTVRNKKIYFPKYAATNGALTVVLLESGDSKVRKALYNTWETKIKDGVQDAKAGVLGDIEITVYNHNKKASRTYTILGSVLASMEEEFTLPEEGAEAVKITLTINFSDYKIKFS